MLKAAFKNYGKHIKYLPITMGIVFFAVLIFVFVFVSGVLVPIRDASREAFENVFEYFYSGMSGISLRDILQNNFMRDFLQGVPAALEGVGDNLKTAVTWRIILAAGFVIIAEQVAGILARRAMRKSVYDETSLRGFTAWLLRTLGSAAAWVIFFVVSYFWIFAVVVLPVVSYILKRFISLVLTWRIYFKEKHEFKEIVSPQNFFRLLGADMLMLSLNFGILIGFGFLTGTTFAIMLGIPLLTYNRAVMDTTSANFFRDKERKGKLAYREVERHAESEVLEAYVLGVDNVHDDPVE